VCVREREVCVCVYVREREPSAGYAAREVAPAPHVRYLWGAELQLTIHVGRVPCNFVDTPVLIQCEDLGQLGQDEPASGCCWSHCSAPLIWEAAPDVTRSLLAGCMPREKSLPHRTSATCAMDYFLLWCFGCWGLGLGFWVLGSESRVLDFGFGVWVLGFGFWSLGTGNWE